MQILPAIDIKEGQVVRLFKGDFNQKTVVNPDVIGQSKIFAQAGIDFIHVVDLDGAFDGRATNRDLIAKLKKESGLGVEVGGGIRTLEQIEDYLAVGIDRVIIGSMAVKIQTLSKLPWKNLVVTKSLSVSMPRMAWWLQKVGLKQVMLITSA